MKKTLSTYIILSIVVILITACSVSKDAALNRGFHSVTTKYNVLYNGNVAFEKGLKELNDAYKDDYLLVSMLSYEIVTKKSKL